MVADHLKNELLDTRRKAGWVHACFKIDVRFLASAETVLCLPFMCQHFVQDGKYLLRGRLFYDP